MARWRLQEDHYLNAYRVRRGPTEWEYEETDRMTGETNRQRYVVQLYINKDSIVCRKGSEQAGDNVWQRPDGVMAGMGPIVYEGPPTPSMEPMDEEAERITAEAKAKLWGNHPIESLQSQGLLSGLEKQLGELIMRIPQSPSVVSDAQVSKDEFEELKNQLAVLMAEKAEREAAPKGVRR